MKKGQITPFIILGILIIIATSTLIYIKQMDKTGLDVEINQKYVMDGSIEPVRMYIESCLKQISEDPIHRISQNGGKTNPTDYRYYNGSKISYICQNKDNFGCVNSVLLKEEMEHDIEKEIMDDISSCINLQVFSEQGYKIKEEPLSVDVRIGLTEVEIKAHYPLTFIKNSSTLKIENFKAKHSLPLGILYLQATNIANIENSQTNFNSVEFASKNGMQINVEKHKPYPDIVYSLKSENLKFNFAIQGEDTVSKISFQDRKDKSSLGCCYIKYDNNCYKNVEQTTCEAKGGIYDPNSACVCPVIENLNDNTCKGETCNTCNITIGNKETLKEHGESWCSYDSITGNGNDYVGSRHILHSCIDGKEVIEECRDFREEICTQTSINENNNTLTQATCRINRWNDCSFCESESCCKDSQNRDCSWELVETGDMKCFPEVPPGFRFWEGNGKEICSIADTQKECSGFSCENNWITANARLCKSYGDCGNYRNIQNEITKDGFFHTSAKGIISDSIYLDDEVFNYDYPELNLDPYSTQTNPILKNYATESTEKISLIVSSYYSFLDQVSKIKSSKYYKNDEQENIKTLNVAICNVWEAPDAGKNCQKCEEGISPCTEYKCMSLGKECVFEENKGIPSCSKIKKVSKEKPIVSIPKDSIQPKYTIEESSLEINEKVISGIKIKEKIKPYQKISFLIETSSDTVCKMSYLPDSTIISGIRISEEGFTKNHSISFRVPPQPRIPEKLFSLLNSTDNKGLVENMFNIKNSINDIENNGMKSIFTSIFGPELINNKDKELSSFVKLFTTDIPNIKESIEIVLNKINDNSYYMFFSCVDQEGKESVNPFFIDVTIDSFEDDNKAPVLIGSIPENGSLFAFKSESIESELYFDEPSECRYSYEDKDFSEMENSLTCSDSIYDFSSEFGGSYLCKDSINASNDIMNIFVRCRDNPQKIDEIDFSVLYSNESQNMTEIQFSESNDADNKTFETNAKNISIQYYLDDKKECILSYSPGIRVAGNCSVSDNKNLGLYSCLFNMSIDNRSSTINSTNNSNNISASILCNTKINYTQNTNKNSIIYQLERSEDLTALDYGPKNEIHTMRPLLYIETSSSRNVKCGYYKELTMGVSQMNNIEEYKFSKILNDATEGDNTYYVYCQDEYNNELFQKIRFFIAT